LERITQRGDIGRTMSGTKTISLKKKKEVKIVGPKEHLQAELVELCSPLMRKFIGGQKKGYTQCWHQGTMGSPLKTYPEKRRVRSDRKGQLWPATIFAVYRKHWG